MRQNRTWFAAVQVEKRMMGIILFLIVLVGAFGLVSSLVMTVNSKRSDIAILRTQGATRGSIMRIFMVQGAFIATAGALGISPQEAENLYEMLLRQKLYYAPLCQIRRVLAEQKQSKYAFLEMGSPLEIYLHNRKTQLRHRVAVAVKSSCLYQKHKT